MTNEILTAFESIGAEATIETRGFTFEIDVLRHEGREAFKLTCPWSDAIVLHVRDVKPKMRHLVLDVAGPRSGARYPNFPSQNPFSRFVKVFRHVFRRKSFGDGPPSPGA
jgi:hypothetical protein